MYEYHARVLRIIDADTLALTVDLGCDVSINLTVRLFGIDAPERYTDLGKAATSFVADWLVEHADTVGRVILHTDKNRREKYGRYLGTVLSGDGSRCLNDDLVAADHAVEYLP